MSLELSPNDAQALYLGHIWGLISLEQIVQYAEGVIVKLDGVPSGELCDLAICQIDHQLRERLSVFSKESHKWETLKVLLRKHVDPSKMNTAELYNLYYYISNYVDWNDPKPWRTIKSLTHELRWS